MEVLVANLVFAGVVATCTWYLSRKLNPETPKIESTDAASIECPHIWSPWEVYRKGDLTSGGVANGYYLVQKRTCDACGEAQLKRQNV